MSFPSPVNHGGTLFLRALALCVLMAAVLILPFTIPDKSTSEALFVGALLIAIPTFLAVHRGWNRWLWWRRLQSSLAAATAAPQDAEKQAELGVMASVAGEPGIAREAFLRARALVPGHPDATVGLGHLLASEGDLEGALLHFSEVAASHPDHFAAHFGMGGVHQRKEQFARALACYEKALALEPDDRYTLHELARCHLALGDLPRALEYRARSAEQGVRDTDLDRQLRSVQTG